MLYEVLAEIEQANGPVLIKDLSQKLNLDPGTLMGMIEFWVRKGRLQDDDLAQEEALACVSGGCQDHCFGPGGCVMTAKMPKTYSVKKKEID